MALSPQDLRDATFKTVKRGGLDPDEVAAFKVAAADALQQAIQDATAMEARARAAVARLQELSQQQAAAAETPETAEPERVEPEAPRLEPTVDEAETISRTLLLAQRTADTTIAEAEAEAEAKRSSAEAEAEAKISTAEAEAQRLIEAARAESRRAGEAERVRVEGEVQALLARRDFLESDVDQLQQHLGVQRERILEVVAQLQTLADGDAMEPMRKPQLSASDQGAIGGELADADEAERAADDVADVAADDAAADDAAADDEPDVAELIDEVVDTADRDEVAEIARIDDPADDRPDDGRHSLFDDER